MVRNKNNIYDMDDMIFEQVDDYKKIKNYESYSQAFNDLMRMAFEYIKEKQEEAEDEYLLALALKREKNDTGATYSHEEVWAEFGITQEDIDEMEDVELEYELPN